MPIPTPTTRESRQEFISRFMSNQQMINDFPEVEQRLAVAYREWRKYQQNRG